MHGLPSEGAPVRFCLMKCKSAGKVSAEKSWQRQLCGSQHHSSLSAELLHPKRGDSEMG